MIWIILSIVIYVICGILAYKYGLNDIESKFEKIWFSIFWILLVPLYIIHYIHNNL